MGQNRLAIEESAQVVRESRGIGVALARLLLQALQADRLEVAGDLGLKPSRRNGLQSPHHLQRLDQGRPLERRAAGEELVEDRAERVQVRQRADLAGLA